jgi:hypothetical protein
MILMGRLARHLKVSAVLALIYLILVVWMMTVLGRQRHSCFGNSCGVGPPIVDANRYERHLGREQSTPRLAACLQPGACLAA